MCVVLQSDDDMSLNIEIEPEDEPQVIHSFELVLVASQYVIINTASIELCSLMFSDLNDEQH